jgi:hypothetical protein
MSGYIVYEGPSMFDKKPIVAIVTLKSTNDKTGNMAQLWILSKDVAPHDAVKSGEDQSVCGGCKHRHNKGGACYVLPFQGPLSVYRSYKRGNYPMLNDENIKSLKGRKLRLGAYGDPAMVPQSNINVLKNATRGMTGYTHQWMFKRLSSTMDNCQGSVDSLAEAAKFKAMYPNGHYFRVTSDISDIQPNEVQCPADTSGVSCMECMMCDGNTQDIVIEVHGAKASRFKPEIEVMEV